MKRLVLAAVVMGLGASEAPAAVLFSVSQVGANVVINATGTFDKSLATQIDNTVASGAVLASPTLFVVGSFSQAISYAKSATSGSIGSLGVYHSADVSTGGAIGWADTTGNFSIYSNYVSNSAINSSSTYNNSTIASLGLDLGTYTFSVGGNDVTLNVGPAATPAPEPETWALMAAGFGLLGGALRRRRVAVRFA